MNHLTKLTDFSAPIYDLIFRSFWLGREKNFRQRFFEVMDLADNESVLDLGCGTGTLALMIADRMNGRGRISGIDLSPRMIEIAKRKASWNGRQVEYKVANSLALPFYDETFDVVVTSLIYHHLISSEDKARTLSEIHRVLKPEGRYVAAEFTKFTVGNLFVVHDSLIRGITLFNVGLLEENSFHMLEKVEISKGITIISARKGVGV